MRAILILLATCLLAVGARAQSAYVTIAGQVTDAGGEPIPMAGVAAPGLRAGVVTNAEGRFQLSVPAAVADSQLIISCMGYAPLKTTLRKAAAQTSFTLKETALETATIELFPRTKGSYSSGFYRSFAYVNSQPYRFVEAEVVVPPFEENLEKAPFYLMKCRGLRNRITNVSVYPQSELAFIRYAARQFFNHADSLGLWQKHKASGHFWIKKNEYTYNLTYDPGSATATVDFKDVTKDFADVPGRIIKYSGLKARAIGFDDLVLTVLKRNYKLVYNPRLQPNGPYYTEIELRVLAEEQEPSRADEHVITMQFLETAPADVKKLDTKKYKPNDHLVDQGYKNEPHYWDDKSIIPLTEDERQDLDRLQAAQKPRK